MSKILFFLKWKIFLCFHNHPRHDEHDNVRLCDIETTFNSEILSLKQYSDVYNVNIP